MKLTEEDLKNPQIYLANVRTDLARERTILAYIHMAFSLVIGGLALLGFSDHVSWFQHIGVVCVLLGGLLFCFAVRYYFRKKTEFRNMIRFRKTK